MFSDRNTSVKNTEEPKAVIWAKVNRGAGQRGGWTVKWASHSLINAAAWPEQMKCILKNEAREEDDIALMRGAGICLYVYSMRDSPLKLLFQPD